jgi:CMP-N,N'-diacetyllegionaminic acid synthase
MRILAIIPARGGSKGVPGKNIKLLGDKPLIAYSIQSALQSKLLTTVMVSSDCLEIIEVAKHWKADVPFQRPEKLAQDTTPTLAVVQHVVQFYEDKGEVFDAVCLLQPTNPFREEGFVDAAIQQFISSNTDALVSVLTVPHEYNPHWTFEVDNKGCLKIATGEQTLISRRQELPQAFHRDGALYITKTAVIKAGSLYGNSLAYMESNPELYVNIDTLSDWEKAEQMINKHQK